MKILKQSFFLLSVPCFSLPLIAQTIPTEVAIEAKIGNSMAHTGAKGMGKLTVRTRPGYFANAQPQSAGAPSTQGATAQH